MVLKWGVNWPIEFCVVAGVFPSRPVTGKVDKLGREWEPRSLREEMQVTGRDRKSESSFEPPTGFGVRVNCHLASF